MTHESRKCACVGFEIFFAEGRKYLHAGPALSCERGKRSWFLFTQAGA